MAWIAFFIVALASAVASGDEFLIVYTAKWCGPCKQFHRDFEADPSLVGGREVVEVDIDAQPFDAQRHGITSVPAFLLYEDGKESRRMLGYTGKEPLKKWLEGE